MAWYPQYLDDPSCPPYTSAMHKRLVFSLLLALPILPMTQARTLTNFTVPIPEMIGPLTFTGLVHTVTEICIPTDPCRSRFHANLVGVTAMDSMGNMYNAVGALDTDMLDFFETAPGFMAFGNFMLVPMGPGKPPNPSLPLTFEVMLDEMGMVMDVMIFGSEETGLVRRPRSRGILKNVVAALRPAPLLSRLSRPSFRAARVIER